MSPDPCPVVAMPVAPPCLHPRPTAAVTDDPKFEGLKVRRGAWVAQLVRRSTLRFCLGQDLGVVGLSPAPGSTFSAESA